MKKKKKKKMKMYFTPEGVQSTPGLPKGMRRAGVYLAIPASRLYEAVVVLEGQIDGGLHPSIGCTEILQMPLNTRYPTNQAQWQLYVRSYRIRWLHRLSSCSVMSS